MQMLATLTFQLILDTVLYFILDMTVRSKLWHAISEHMIAAARMSTNKIANP